jgi:hypothetical protein
LWRLSSILEAVAIWLPMSAFDLTTKELDLVTREADETRKEKQAEVRARHRLKPCPFSQANLVHPGWRGFPCLSEKDYLANRDFLSE